MNNMVNIHPEAIIGKNVTVSPFTTIEKDVEIGEGTWIGPNVTIMEGARIGKDCKIFPGAVISAEPQDLKYKGEKTLTYIGDRTTIREAVTINRGTTALGYTKIGDDCLIMATVHVAHDCVIGNHVILVNGVGLAGHIEIDDYAIVGGMVPVHQFTKIGAHTLIAGATLVRKDVPPYVKAAREPMSYAGVNALGLRRRGFDNEQIETIQNVYRILFQEGLSNTKAVEKIKLEIPESEEREVILNFVENSDRGIMKGYYNE
ncbi:acyl-[acyl-carrier-protein]--UDP-N-acetylglucosamine O-acyltransferase [Flavobacteriaceae bacterium UJ101]|nr:acyl-[acyl-carrier-protein]--UDP-N-acetylglucosamine O-acyltransferase [Flavobacteriaceae bacterium UJ101]